MVNVVKKYFFVFLLIIIFPCANAKDIKLALDWFVNPNHAPIILAKELGYFKEAGLYVDILTPADPSDPPKWVAAGKVDMAIDYEPHFEMEIKNGLPLKKVGSLINSPLACMIALKEKNIKKLSDIKGTRIGYSVSGSDGVILNAMLNHVGLTEKDIILVNVRYGLLQALLSHQVDVIMGAMRNVEVPELKMLGKNAVTFYPENHGVKKYAELIFVVNKNNNDKESIQKFLDALEKSKLYIKNHPDLAWEKFSKNRQELVNLLNAKIWERTVLLF